MKKKAGRFAQLLLAMIFLITALLGFSRTAAAADPPVPLSSLAPGTVVNFVGYNWIVLNPSTGYLLMQDNYSSQPFDCPSDPHDVYGDNVFDPNNQYNIGYYLNNLNPSQFSGTGFYQRIWYSYPDYKSLIIDHTFDIVGADYTGTDQALVSTATTHVGLLSCSEWRNYSKYYNPSSGFLDNPSAPFWTINPNYATSYNDLSVSTSGYFFVAIDNAPQGVRPTLYLNPNALISGGKVTYYLVGTFPIVTGINSARGPLTGGTSVTLTGYNFTGATGVSFGSVAAESFTFNSDNSITATAPAQAAGTVHVTVTSANGTSSTYPTDQFTYAPLPVVTGLSPAVGSVSGGATATITGCRFIGATAVNFGSVAASFTVTNDNTITAIIPAQVAGVVDVTVINHGQSSPVVSAGRFTYSTNELVGWWKLDEGSGTTAHDSSGYGDNGTLTNPVWSTDHPGSIDQVSTSLDFSGGTSSFTAPVPTVATGNVSISAWVKWNGTTGISNYQPIAYNGNPGANGYGLFLDSSGNLEVLCGGVAWLDTTTKLTPNTWQQVAMVEDGAGNWMIYLNGSQVSQVSGNPIAPAPGDKMLIGYFDPRNLQRILA